MLIINDFLYCSNCSNQLKLIGVNDDHCKSTALMCLTLGHVRLQSVFPLVQAHNLEKAEDILPLYVKLARFLTDIGEYSTAEGLLSEVISRVEDDCDETSQLLCEPLLAMVALINLEGRWLR